jgi:hypothetical protein
MILKMYCSGASGRMRGTGQHRMCSCCNELRPAVAVLVYSKLLGLQSIANAFYANGTFLSVFPFEL